MAGRTDLNKLRQRYMARQKQVAEQDQRYWKPEIGNKYGVRLCPPPDGCDLWFKEFGVHYSVYEDQENPTETCPRLTKGTACPVCEFVRGLWRSGSDEEKELARKIGAKKRYISNVLVVSGPNSDPKTPRLWSYGPMIWDQIMAFVNTDDGVVPIDDPATGHNLTLTVTEKRTGKQTFPNYLVSPIIHPSAIPDQSSLSKLNDYEEVIDSKLRPYEVIKAALMGKAEPSTTNEQPVEEPPTEQPTGDPATDRIIDDTSQETSNAPAPAQNPEAAKPATGTDLVAKARAALAARAQKIK